MLFKAKDVEDRFQQTLEQWLDVYEDLEDVCDLFFGVHYNQGMTSTNRFLNVVQALETYHRVRFGKYDLPQKEHSERVKEIVSFIPKGHEHRQWANDMLYNSNYTSLKTRLIDLVIDTRPAADKLIGQTQSFAKWAKDTRNFYTHRDERSSMKVARGRRLELLNYSLLWLMRIHFMREVGFTPRRCEELLSKNQRFEGLCDACAEAPWNLD